MLLDPKFNITHLVFKEARRYVEEQWVPFFDFYRNCAFGFVQVAQGRKGFYCHLIVHEDGHLEAYCNCRQQTLDKVCGHAFALYLKLVRWPMEREHLSQSFDNYHLSHFFKTLGRKHYGERLNPKTNPALDLTQVQVDERLLNYWDFTNTNEAIGKRDRQALAKALTKVRTPTEVAMLDRGMPSSQIMFEESVFYPLCKLFFFLEHQSGLEIHTSLQEHHQVRLEINFERKLIFSWLLPVDSYLKGIRQQRDYWQDKTLFEVQRQGVPVSYRVRFLEDNSLEIESGVRMADGTHIPMDQLQVPGASNLFYHEKMGYFHIQTGLTPFEMEFGDPGLRIIDAQRVSTFLTQHKETLGALDRSLMDEALFDNVIVDRFDAYQLQLLDCQDHCFTFHLEARLGGQIFGMDELRSIFASRGRYRKLGGKLFDTSGFDGCNLRSVMAVEVLALSPTQLFRMLFLFGDRLEVSPSELTEAVYNDLKGFKAPDAPDLSHTNLNLRDYQQLGYSWLYFLKSFGLGGLLCDQMGLGKTHQAMALIAAIAAEKSQARILVIAPTSVLFHWKDKLSAFCPGLHAYLYHGSDRNPGSATAPGRVVLSSYGTLRNDVDALSACTYDLIVFDEIQYLKNKTTKAYQSISRLPGLCKIGLTGTPIENEIAEIKSLMDLVFPGYLGTEMDFRRFFADPIVKFNTSSARERLKDMIKPFTLRRSKKEVLIELPDKTEDMRTLALGEYEMDLYKEIKSIGKKNMANQAREAAFLHAFQLVDKLKRICNHPALYFGNDGYGSYPSTKWNVFTELLGEALASGEKVVVFTQYLGMIAMFQKYLGNLGVEFATITGKTRDREAEQKRFMTHPDCRVFLGSVRAAGVGIDLTEASILIHYDRWWNSAREEQATDRIHRIGQRKNVQIYKFMALNTVEERINRIIERKRDLMEDLVTFDGANMAKSFSLDEILDILA